MGWQDVRREIARLDWDTAAPATSDVLADWAQVVARLVEIRRALGPVTTVDPMALLATATSGAVRVPDAAPSPAASLSGVHEALSSIVRTTAPASDADRRREIAAVTAVSYQLAHWVGIRVDDDRVRAWVQAGETALDGALHARVGRTATGAGLEAWTDALASLQPIAGTAVVRRSVALGHLAILRATHTLVTDAGRSGALPQPYSDTLLAGLRELAEAHQVTLSRLEGPGSRASRVDQAVMLRLGDAVRHVTGRPASAEPAHVRLDARLRSSVGHAVVAANLTQDAAAPPAARTLQQAALEYLANPRMLRDVDSAGGLPLTVGEARASAASPEARAGRESVVMPPVAAIAAQPSIALGTVLDATTVRALCHSRDLGTVAAAADPADPPALLRGIEASQWPRLVAEGQQAVVDLVASVIPMVYARSRRVFHAEDLRGEMFVRLMRAASLFDPERIGPERWPHYVWSTLDYSRWRGVDAAGVPLGRHKSPPTIVAIGDQELPSRDPNPGVVVEEREAVRTITDAVAALPASLRDPLLQSMQGRSASMIAGDLGISRSTALRRVAQAREQVRERLTEAVGADAVGTPYETVNSRPLARSQRLEEKQRGPTVGSVPGPGPMR